MGMNGTDGGLDGHALAYRREIRAYELRRGRVADRTWARCSTSPPPTRTCGRAWPAGWTTRGRADLDGLDNVSRGARLLLDVARALFREEGAVDLAAVARRLDERSFAVAMGAVRLYREGHIRGDNVEEG